MKESASPEKAVFEKMTKTEQVSHLFRYGEELLQRQEKDFSISLFGIYGFFVEIWYRIPQKQIEKIRVVTAHEVTRKYDQEIALEDMY